MWIVRRVLRVPRNGERVLLMPGDEIPEAANWERKDFWIRRGYIQEIPRPTSAHPVTIKVQHLYKTRLVAMTLTGNELEASPDKSDRRRGKRDDLELPISEPNTGRRARQG